MNDGMVICRECRGYFFSGDMKDGQCFWCRGEWEWDEMEDDDE